jgi:DNA-binding MarR family transcriptional regulator
MVKRIDEKTSVLVTDHIGWQLWTASRDWKDLFDTEMIAAGYTWFREARADIIPLLERHGTRQSVLVERMRLSKQAVQQLVDQLAEDGILERHVDPDDRRGKVLMLSAKGLKLIGDANRIKLRIENQYRKLIGETQFQQLKNALAALAERLGN